MSLQSKPTFLTTGWQAFDYYFLAMVLVFCQLPPKAR